MDRGTPIVAIVTLASLLAMPAGALAQASTPTPGAAPAIDMRCTAEPRKLDELLALWFDAEGNPAATPALSEPIAADSMLPRGEPLAAASLSTIDRRTREWIACLVVSGEYARAYSYLTDNLIARFGPDLASPDQDTPAEVRALLAGQLAGTPISDQGEAGAFPALVGPTDGRQLPDGRIGALWEVEGDRAFIIYKQVNDRWLIDDILDVLE